MLQLGLLVLLAAVAHGCGVPEVQPNVNININRVVNGEEALPHSWPWQVSLQVKHGSRFHHTCGGTLIGPRWVLTAGHCIWPGDVYRVVLGEHDINAHEGSEQIRDVMRILVHPAWDINFVSRGNDIALLKLDKSPVLGGSVGVACLPEAGEILAHGAPCFLSGWGNLNTHGPMPDRLQQALLPVVQHSVCSRSGWWGVNAKTTMICAGGADESGCNGDSGGPLSCQGADGRWYVHGVTSFVSSLVCNQAQKPTVFTRTSAFMDWISNIILKY